MDYVGLDLGTSASQVCLLTDAGQLWEQRLKTSPDSLRQAFGSRPRSRILLEASTESEWVARVLEALGHEVIVADPNFAPMYATRSKRVKTDARDARALCEAARLGAYREVRRRSERQRLRQAELAVRDSLVRARTQQINLCRALLRASGLRVRSGAAASFVRRVGELEVEARLRETLAPSLAALEVLNAELAGCGRRLMGQAREDPVVRRLLTVPGVGAVTALSFAAAVDEVGRFPHAKQVRAYLGLVPSEHSSGERRQRGGITKAGNGRVRRLLVECGWHLLTHHSEAGAGLRRWGERIARRRGSQVAAVALGRKLAGILFALWRDGSEYRAGGAGGEGTSG
ncbi:MAG TPA: IS110 family transposase [Pyrinomonadaceae bacterium]|jgi:transposase